MTNISKVQAHKLPKAATSTLQLIQSPKGKFQFPWLFSIFPDHFEIPTFPGFPGEWPPWARACCRIWWHGGEHGGFIGRASDLQLIGIMRQFTGYCVTRNETLYWVWRNRQEAESDISLGFLTRSYCCVASIVIGQEGGACSVLVDNVIRTIRGACTVSGHDGQTFLEKIRGQASKFFQFAQPWFKPCHHLNKS